MRLSRKRITLFRRMIFTWWAQNRRDLPWRRTSDPYRIMVSEVMLQQTQVVRVTGKYEEFLLRFPDARSLAEASPAEVLRIWKGLGYNKRALYLKKTAEMIISEFGGKSPSDEINLLKLPGLGKYTARAILVFAFHRDIPALDTNIRRVITHFFYHDTRQTEKELLETAGRLLPPRRSWEWHQALMDFASKELKSVRTAGRKPQKPFRSSDRFYRGRIIDILRAGGMTGSVLSEKFVREYGKNRRDLFAIIGKLETEGLIERNGDRLRLPE